MKKQSVLFKIGDQKNPRRILIFKKKAIDYLVCLIICLLYRFAREFGDELVTGRYGTHQLKIKAITNSEKSEKFYKK